jgi:hypothetical protein
MLNKHIGSVNEPVFDLFAPISIFSQPVRFSSLLFNPIACIVGWYLLTAKKSP